MGSSNRPPEGKAAEWIISLEPATHSSRGLEMDGSSSAVDYELDRQFVAHLVPT
jgi:hypothetical protein